VPTTRYSLTNAAASPVRNENHSRPLRTALVGCGQWGMTLARAATATGRFDLSATVDAVSASAQIARRTFDAAWSSTDPADVWRDDEIEAVLVATPAASHFALASQALAAGKHALVEKPLALSVTECATLGVIAADANLVLMVGHTFMYSPHIAAVKEVLDTGTIGNLHYMHLQRLSFGAFRDDVNVTWNLGPHDVSILNYWAGVIPLGVRCVEQYCTRPGRADVAFVTIDYGEFFGHAHLSCADPTKVRSGTVVGSSGGVTYNGVTKQVAITHRKPEILPFVPVTVNDIEPLQEECQHFARCVAEGIQPRTDVSHALSVVSALEAATASAASRGAWMPVEPLRRKELP
jgi:predicted dehydrogenase